MSKPMILKSIVAWLLFKVQCSSQVITVFLVCYVYTKVESIPQLNICQHLLAAMNLMKIAYNAFQPTVKQNLINVCKHVTSLALNVDPLVNLNT